jgi:hypothetical protein
MVISQIVINNQNPKIAGSTGAIQNATGKRVCREWKAQEDEPPGFLLSSSDQRD